MATHQMLSWYWPKSIPAHSAKWIFILDTLEIFDGLLYFILFSIGCCALAPFMEPDSREASIDVSSGSSFRKPGPGSPIDSSYVL